MIIEYFSKRYDIEGPLAMGGSALIFKVHEIFSDTDRILKFSRPLERESEIAKALTDEGYKLRSLKHPNVLDLFELGTIDYMDNTRKIGFTIIEFANGGDWTDKIESDLQNIGSPQQILKNILRILYDVVKGLEFIHEKNFVHMDIKPGNVLLTENGIAKISDLGFAKLQEEKTTNNQTMIGFSKPYAHPDLLNYSSTGSSDNRLIARLRYHQLRKKWDIYALGQSLLEFLSKIDKRFQDEARPLQLFRYIHLMACRMLDGHNTEKGKFYNELSSGLSRSAFEEVRYESMKEIRLDIEKELGFFVIEKEIPELNFFSRETIHGSEWKPTVLTPRLKDIINHPIFSRLSRVSQLGLVRFLYPTASHSRFDHMLGTFSNACAYVSALYHDENPLFKQILRKKDVQALLVTSLLHDLGQYPLAHDLEDLHPNFKHTIYSKELLKSTTQDDKGKTISQIIGDTDGWDIAIHDIEEIMNASEIKDYTSVLTRHKIRAKLLSTIISGPIDVDKTDYLMRDSRECRLPYGYAIDFDRLLQTITIDYDNKTNRFQLAVYHKGRACAESISLTRYLMFASSYWHHTSRTYKTMLQYGVKIMLNEIIGTSSEKKFWDEFREFIINLTYNPKKKDDLLNLLKNKGPSMDIAETDLGLISFMHDRSPESAKKIFQMLASRDLFKRLVSLDYSSEKRLTSTMTPWDMFQTIANNWDRKLELSKKLQERLRVEVRKRAETSSSNTLNEVNITKFDILMEDPNISILVDVPPIKDIEQPLKFVKEMMEDRHHDIPIDKMSQLSEAWMGAIENLFRSICTMRIFCHPDIRNQIRASLTYDEIETMAREELSKITAL